MKVHMQAGDLTVEVEGDVTLVEAEATVRNLFALGVTSGAERSASATGFQAERAGDEDYGRGHNVTLQVGPR